ncbi:MAG: methyl-accepting chemotaxis protein [Peptococcaceae bacterium]|nr:methyl-accepting chemotaxis protein [Peptococcaceae bacterium]
MRFQNLSLKFKIGFTCIVGMILLLGAVMYGVNFVVTKQAKDTATQKAKADLALGYEILDKEYPGPWRREGDKLYKGDTLMNGNFAIVDKIGRLTNGDTVTIFCGDTRVATNVKKDGKRAVGTVVSDIVAETTLKNGRDYYGEANVVGHWYQTAYTPIKDSSGQIIGMWYVGAPTAFVSKMIAETFKTVGLISIIALILISTVLWWFMNRQMIDPLHKLIAAAEKVAKGDLTQRIQVRSRDEVGSLAAAFNKMIDNLKEIVMNIKHNANNLASSAEQLSANAEETSAGANETSSSMQQTSQTVEQMAQNVQNIKEASDEASNEAEEGRQGIDTIKKQMNTIRASTQNASTVIGKLDKMSSEIGNIVETISNIADQTNLLALNAAIEAARAGEQGRGFAVVAEEVRKLAEQSANAAAEIQQLISKVQTETKNANDVMEDGVKEVEEGVNVVNKVGASFAQIIDRVKGLASQIDELSSGAEQVSSAVQNVAATTEESTAAMEEIASSTESLTQMAEELQKMAARFRIDDAEKLTAAPQGSVK